MLERKRRQVLSATTDAELSAIDLRDEALQAEVSIWLGRPSSPTSDASSMPLA